MKGRALVTGGAGFVGSNLVRELLARGADVTVFDNLLLGRRAFVAPLEGPRCRFILGDLEDRAATRAAVRGHDIVFHLAANSDIGEGTRRPDTDLRLGTLATYNLLDAMREEGVRRIVFSSSSTIYGQPKRIPTAEDDGPCLPISLYGASKLACEGLISAHVHLYGFRAWIFRFANVIGRNATHGAVLDFCARLREDPRRLTVLGDGRQAKPYLHVDECVGGILFGVERASELVNVFNLGPEGATSVAALARMVLDATGRAEAEIVYSGGERGWPGDVPQVRLDPSRLAATGWRPRLASDDAARQGVREIVEQVMGDR
ncbi:MAG: NAD-dependent epimerase/dehydratase family protein [Planctomycetes bacterium]|nr:NAD-dependent epimerase/dehydratase family protein [Planctomycetota bacterium]